MTDLTSNQRRAIEALAAGESINETARKANVSPRTIYRWRSDPTFAAALRTADADHLAETARKLTAATDRAVEVLLGVLDDTKAAAGVKLRAVELVLTHRAKFYELLTISDRLEALEGAVFPGKAEQG